MKIRVLWWMLLCGVTAAATPALAAGLSGTYVGTGSNGAFMVQIVETENGHLTGRYEQVVLRPNGTINDMNATITGAADGQTVVVTIKPSEFLAGSMAASGSIEGRLLHLTGGGNGGSLILNLVRSDEADFRTKVAALTEQAQEINDARERQQAAQRQARLEADRLANLRSLTQRMAMFATKADSELPKFPLVEQRYQDITWRMRGALARERSIYGGGQAAVARGQLSVAINQAAVQAGQLHISVQSAYRDFDFAADQLTHEFVGASQGCHDAHVLTNTNTAPVGRDDLNSACLRFFDSAKSFQQRVSELRAAFAQVGDVWNTERRQQDAIVQASTSAVQ